MIRRAYAFILAALMFAFCNIHAQVVMNTLAGTGTGGYSGDGGSAFSAEFFGPEGMALDNSGNLYVADVANNVIRKINLNTGIITTVAGNGTPGNSGLNGPATSAQLNGATGVFADAAGNIYIADAGNNVVKKVYASTDSIAILIGTGEVGYYGDGFHPLIAKMNGPSAVFVDGLGNVYICDTYNNVVRELFASDNKLRTIAGNGTQGYSGDGGPADSATLNSPYGVWVDQAGFVYIADANSTIRKIDTGINIIRTIAGNGTAGFSGDGGLALAAELNVPTGVSTDGEGNVYIADWGNNRIRKVDAITGNISTIAGRDTAGYYGDGGLADSAGLNGPFAVLVNGNSNDIFISDEYDNRIRRIGIASGINAVSNNFDFNVYPNPANTGFTVETGNAFKGIIEIDNLQGQKVYQAPATANETHIDALQLANGLYFVYLKNSTGSSVQRVMVNH